MSSNPIPLLLAIPGEAPAGIAARYEPAFIRLESEIAKLAGIAQDAVAWHSVADDAADILCHTSKDLLAAVYLARAWHELYGAKGFHDGLLIIADVLIIYWEHGFPAVTRLRARRAALQWLSDGLTSITPPSDGDVGAWQGYLGDCLATLERMHQHLLPHVDDGDTGLGGLRRTVQASLASLKPASSSLPNGQTILPTSNAADQLDRAQALHRLRSAAEWFLRLEPHSPVGYLAQRAADLGDKPFHAVFRELLAHHQPAQQELWHVLGIPAEPGE